MNKSFSWVKQRLLSGLLIFLFLVFFTTRANAGSYDEDMPTSYAGMVKPQNGLADYDGTVNSSYSTAYIGNYLGGGEGSGSHPGVDIQDGNCALTPVKAIAEGTILHVYAGWRDAHPDRDPCGNNIALGGFGNYVVIKHDDAPGRDGYSGASKTVYAHLWSISSDIEAGKKVLRGTLLGLVGSTGGSTGPHLHFQMDRNVDQIFPWWPQGLDVDTTEWQDTVTRNTFNPMRFVQAHLVSTDFVSQVYTDYYDVHGSFIFHLLDQNINHEWFMGSPGNNMDPDGFSVKVENAHIYLHKGYWIFYVTVDDGAKLWIDNELVLNQWANRLYPATFKVAKYLSGGNHSIKLYYYENVDNATIQLAWQKGPEIRVPLIYKP